ncbi:MAG TPA: glutathione-dependent reductase [Halieaceae bacterium]|jgi:putative glutathione S-transferase|uniref:glutathione S-transferase family protein n=1 Tax=Haliea TaxID=475794 RepID=UPI000C5DE858|nr:glutathione S-transferase family protein [Haliea sp.]HAN67060.1 glutathione-dependent reductase [Halieaceae bacterium]MAD63140.1 glutathione-dependent reductase [Haliea sp.]MAY94068.1 glutathione-dependent reductase [Haliea sp.]MBK40185.1 glutathione-dependent reductase [Haliea sp.]MBP71916.1 glutathione-dependent reductase [Haliea sp.]|tara:strand:+ start:1797 stop:2768 length:972 start_codon:yes stop_codon:yes gene_type:complete
MGKLVDGQWQDVWYDTDSNEGRFVRESAGFRHWVTADGAAGPTGDDGFAAAAGRYHLYVSLACPWAHRTLIVRALKGLEPLIDVSVVSPLMLENGWTFNRDEGSSGDLVGNADFHHQIYTRAAPNYTGRVTVPVLWDRERNTIVSNESADIIRMLNSAFDALTGNTVDLYPTALHSAINAWNERIYPAVNNGVYRAGFATTQEAYEEAYRALFNELDHLDAQLADQRFLTGERLTEADIRLFTTLIRFDAVYHGHFKCNRQRLEDYRNLPGYIRDIYQQPGVAETVDFHHIKTHYYASHRNINPTGIVPAGPEIDYHAAHGRG